MMQLRLQFCMQYNTPGMLCQLWVWSLCYGSNPGINLTPFRIWYGCTPNFVGVIWYFWVLGKLYRQRVAFGSLLVYCCARCVVLIILSLVNSIYKQIMHLSLLQRTITGPEFNLQKPCRVKMSNVSVPHRFSVIFWNVLTCKGKLNYFI